MDQGLVEATPEGTPQGGPLSPLLSNILLTDLDRELERRDHRFVRYADDANIYVKSEHAGQRVKASITRFLATRLKLKVNEAKSAVAQPWQRKFLGFSFTRTPKPLHELRRGTGPVQATSGTELAYPGRPLGEVMNHLAVYVRVARLFRICETPSVLRDLTSGFAAAAQHVWSNERASRYAELIRCPAICPKRWLHTPCVSLQSRSAPPLPTYFPPIPRLIFPTA